MILTVITAGVFLLLMYMAVWDILKREIQTAPALALLGLAALTGLLVRERRTDMLLGFLLWSAVLFILYAIDCRNGPAAHIGGGDIRLMMVLSALAGLKGFPVMLAAACLVGLICTLFTRKKNLPFAPCLLAGYFVWYLFMVP